MTVSRDIADALPVELVAHVFASSLPELQTCVPSTQSAPLHLTLVSKRWRDIAHSTPSLWTSLALFGIQRVRVDWIPQIQAWLERARDMPLSMLLSNGLKDDYEPFDRMNRADVARATAVIDAVSLRAEQWSTLELNLDNGLFDSQLWWNVRNRLASLHSLTLRGIGHPKMIPEATSKVFATAKSLKRLCCIGSAIHGMLNDLPWNQIVNAKLDVDTRAQYSHILQNCHAVVRMDINVTSGMTRRWKRKNETTIPTSSIDLLESLTIFVTRLGSETLCDMLQMSRAPSLTTFKIFNTAGFIQQAVYDERMHNFLSYHGPGIVEFVLDEYEMPGDPETQLELAGLLSYMPQLRQLSVGRSWFNNHLMKSLTIVVPHKQFLLPELVELSVSFILAEGIDSGPEVHRDKWFDDKHLLHLVRSRTRHATAHGSNALNEPLVTTSLQRLDLGYHPTVEPATIQALKELHASGLQLNIDTYGLT